MPRARKRHFRPYQADRNSDLARVREEPRLVANRDDEIISALVARWRFQIWVKTSRAYGKIIAVKPEYKDMKEIALMLIIPLQYMVREVCRQLRPIA